MMHPCLSSLPCRPTSHSICKPLISSAAHIQLQTPYPPSYQAQDDTEPAYL